MKPSSLFPLKEDSQKAMPSKRGDNLSSPVFIDSRSFLDKNFGTLVILGAMIIAQVAQYAILISRVNALEGNQPNFASQTQHADLARRVAGIESEMVPRSEHLLRDEQLNTRLKSIEDQLHVMNESLVDIQSTQRRSSRAGDR